MSDSVQAFLLFSEDVRLEEGGKPMFLGILGPVVQTGSYAGSGDTIQSITCVTAPFLVEKVDLKLEIEVRHPDAEPECDTYTQTLSRPDGTQSEDVWTFFIPQPVFISEWREGTVVRARLRANETTASVSIRAILFADGEEEVLGAISV
jgi:hypothetical protein